MKKLEALAAFWGKVRNGRGIDSGPQPEISKPLDMMQPLNDSPLLKEMCKGIPWEDPGRTFMELLKREGGPVIGFNFYPLGLDPLDKPKALYTVKALWKGSEVEASIEGTDANACFTHLLVFLEILDLI